MFVVFGATGRLGTATIQELRAHGEKVRAVVRDASRADRLRSLGCAVAEADLHDRVAVQSALRGADAVQVICPPNPKAALPLEDMASIGEVLAHALSSSRPDRIVAISDYGAHRDSGTGVTLGFHDLESRFRKLDLPVTFLRSAEHMENWRRTFVVVAKTGVLPSMHHPLTKVFPTVSSGDVGIAAAELLMSPRPDGVEIVHVEGPKRYTVLEVAEALCTLAGRKVVARELPRTEWVARLVQAGSGESYAGLVAELYDTHNAGAIDAEPGVGSIRRGQTGLEESFKLLGDAWIAATEAGDQP